MPQLVINDDQLPSFAGQRAYPMKRWIDSNTRFVAQVGGIGYGRFCVRAGDQTMRLPTAAGDVTGAAENGFAVRQEFYHQTGVGYADGEPMTVMHLGYMWVEVEAPVVSDAQVFIRTAAGAGGTLLGAVRGDADGGTATALPNARFDCGSISGLAIVRLGE